MILQSLNQRLEVSAEDWSVRPQQEEWHHLNLLHYLSIADKTPLSDEMRISIPSDPGSEMIPAPRG